MQDASSSSRLLRELRARIDRIGNTNMYDRRGARDGERKRNYGDVPRGINARKI